MPTNSIDLYHMQDARNNFDVMRPAPICSHANQFMGQCQNIHVSTNCYYGYHHGQLKIENSHVAGDCEMVDASNVGTASASPQTNARKRSAEDSDTPLTKRFREEVQREKNIEPETKERIGLESSTEDMLESLLWNIHGQTVFHLVQCESV